MWQYSEFDTAHVKSTFCLDMDTAHSDLRLGFYYLLPVNDTDKSHDLIMTDQWIMEHFHRVSQSISPEWTPGDTGTTCQGTICHFWGGSWDIFPVICNRGRGLWVQRQKKNGNSGNICRRGDGRLCRWWSTWEKESNNYLLDCRRDWSSSAQQLQIWSLSNTCCSPEMM